MIIWDWDDTLLPSSYLAWKGLDVNDFSSKKLIDAPSRALLERLEGMVIKILRLSISLGETHIVTNAAKGWVQKSSMVFMPKLYEEFFSGTSKSTKKQSRSRSDGELQTQLKVLSAREKYQKQLPSKFKQVSNLYRGPSSVEVARLPVTR